MSIYLDIEERYISNGDGWQLHVRRTKAPERFRSDLRPIVMIPGYGMNTFILGFHPHGQSMERILAEGGFEVWSACLRTQGNSIPVTSPPATPSLYKYATVDLKAVVSDVLASTTSDRDTVSLVGCSLGGSVAYGHLALVQDHRVGAVITIGAPLRWDAMHPLMKILYRSRTLAGLFRMGGTRRMARILFPILGRMPRLLTIYVNSDHVELRDASDLVNTVDDPHPKLNVDMAQWVRDKDLIIAGVNVPQALKKVTLPLLVISANRDGIVPGAASLSVRDVWGGGLTLHEVGTPEDWYAHADLFIAPEAPEKVFTPMVDWLTEHN